MPELSSGAMLYLAAVENEIYGGALAYLNGEFSSLSRGQNCYISVAEEGGEVLPDPDNSVRDSQGLFMDGDYFPGALTLGSSIGSYIAGEGLRSFARAFINTSGAERPSTDLFIAGTNSAGVAEAIRFVSSSLQYVQINDSTQYDNLSEFTLNMFVRPRTNSDGRYQGIVVKEGVIETWVHPSGNSFGMRANIGGVWYQALTLSFAKDFWNMLTIKHDGSGIRFYMNGNEFYSVNAPGTLTSNNAPIYFGRYPSRATYSHIDLADVQLWNYDLTNAEILAMYQPAARRGCQHAFIAANDPTSQQSLKRSYISADSNTGNPFFISSSQSAGFAEASSYGDQRCFITAGGETTTVFDTRISLDPYTHATWDNIIMVQGNNTHIIEVQLGDIVYPITRFATRIINIPTSYDPLKQYLTKDAWITCYNEITGVKPSYINAINFAQNRKSAHVSGDFSSVSDSTSCFIVNGSVNNSQSAFIEGIPVFRFNYFQSAFINSYREFEQDTMNMHMRGSQPLSSSLRAHIVAPVGFSRAKYAFIMSVKEDIVSSNRSYISGKVGITRPHVLYVKGHFTETLSRPAYVTAIPYVTDGVGCFIQAENPYRATQRAMVRGWASLTDGQNLYLKADINVVDAQLSYVAGGDSMRRATRLYLSGPVATSLSDSTASYVVNTQPNATKFAFIVSNPLSFQRCYILSTGSTQRLKSAYIEA